MVSHFALVTIGEGTMSSYQRRLTVVVGVRHTRVQDGYSSCRLACLLLSPFQGLRPK